jgi:hypothetical protein
MVIWTEWGGKRIWGRKGKLYFTDCKWEEMKERFLLIKKDGATKVEEEKRERGKRNFKLIISEARINETQLFT